MPHPCGVRTGNHWITYRIGVLIQNFIVQHCRLLPKRIIYFIIDRSFQRGARATFVCANIVTIEPKLTLYPSGRAPTASLQPVDKHHNAGAGGDLGAETIV